MECLADDFRSSVPRLFSSIKFFNSVLFDEIEQRLFFLLFHPFFPSSALDGTKQNWKNYLSGRGIILISFLLGSNYLEE